MITPILLAGDDGLSLHRNVQGRSLPGDGESSPLMDLAQSLVRAGCTDPIVVTSPAWQREARRQLAEAGLGDADILITPMPRGSAPAALSAALRLEMARDAILLVCGASDLAADAHALAAAIQTGQPAAEAGGLVTFGLLPDDRAFDHGCLRIAAKDRGAAGPVPLIGHCEPPGRVHVRTLLERGDHLGHAQCYMLRVDTLLAAFFAAAPALKATCRAALDHAAPTCGALLLANCPWSDLEYTSIDPVLLGTPADVRVVALGPAGTGDDRDGEPLACRPSERSADRPGRAMASAPALQPATRTGIFGTVRITGRPDAFGPITFPASPNSASARRTGPGTARLAPDTGKREMA
ncbi:sugar phosphate nucleotidyltransferase [Chachezhania sediminis]|uniref:sugar phosphate nucleotidyltransferase n=1 Tax=Chachezhania sediminis TaxID=2599291 RepID=UPI00131C9DCC|nr:sugar phosphate nucleotidyltransferase [Chachezhania sediminis]